MDVWRGKPQHISATGNDSGRKVSQPPLGVPPLYHSGA
jgi:hypothetical protein